MRYRPAPPVRTRRMGWWKSISIGATIGGGAAASSAAAGGTAAAAAATTIKAAHAVSDASMDDRVIIAAPHVALPRRSYLADDGLQDTRGRRLAVQFAPWYIK